MIHTRISAVINLNKAVSICSVVSITVRLKQTWFNVIGYLLRYQHVNQTAPMFDLFEVYHIELRCIYFMMLLLFSYPFLLSNIEMVVPKFALKPTID
jgi:hypothetical protein